MKLKVLYIVMGCASALALTNCQSKTTATPPSPNAQKQGGNRDDFIRAMQHDIDTGKVEGMTKMSISTPDGYKHDFKMR